MRIVGRWLILFLALAGIGALASACALQPLLSGVRVAPDTISPNADGQDDVTHIFYTIGRTANVSIYFVDSNGARHYFRNEQRRSPGAYDVYWGGVINDPQVRPVEGGGSELVASQVLPDGAYTWVVEAIDDGGHSQKSEGHITLQQADNTLPELHNFTVVPKEFTPNQDGIDDRVSVAYYLTKKAERLQVYLQSAGGDAEARGLKYPITENPTASKADPNDVGYHGYDYDGGVDLNAEPPPDGDYIVQGEAEDRAGNRVVVSTTLTIREGGKPRAEIAGGEINWQGEQKREVSVPLSQTLCFTATVTNIGPVPIRTAGPWPGQLYRFTQNSNTLAALQNEKSWYQQHGGWRFGVNFDTTGVDYPFRWAIGRKEDLEAREVDGQRQYYLLPGRRGHVYGCIQFDAPPPVGTQFFWAGLIHEAVEVANDQVDRIKVVVGVP